MMSMSKRIGANVRLTRYLNEEELNAVRDAVEEMVETIKTGRPRARESAQLK